MLQKTFLYRVFCQDKFLFILFTAFILGQIFFTYKRVENTPFFHFGMYSAIHPPQSQYTVYSIVVDKNSLKYLDFPDYQREVVYNTLASYDGLRQMGFQDTLDRVISKRFSGQMAAGLRQDLLNNIAMDTPYQKWLFQYVADMRLVKTPVIEVSKQQVKYLPDGTLTPVSPPESLFKLRDE